jgi:hypothetical protein
MSKTNIDFFNARKGLLSPPKPSESGWMTVQELDYEGSKLTNPHTKTMSSLENLDCLKVINSQKKKLSRNHKFSINSRTITTSKEPPRMFNCGHKIV